MEQKNYNRIIILVLTVLSAITFLISKNISENKIEQLKCEYYSNYSDNVKKEINTLIQSKKDSTMSLAMALSKDNNFIVDAFRGNETKKLDLKKFSKDLRTHTKFKNVWFQLIDNNGISRYRSWVDKTDDDISKVRMDVKRMLKEPKIQSTISVGLYDMTFKAMIPIYDNKKFIGILEVITHFNSIARKLAVNGVEAVVLVDKVYKDQLKYPFTKIFIGDYYVENLNAPAEYLQYLERKDIKSFINDQEKYTIDEELNTVNVNSIIKDINGNNMGYIVLFKDIDSFEQKEFNKIKQNIVFYMIVVILLISVFGYFVSSRRYHVLTKKNLEEEKKNNLKISYILNTQPYIITIRNENSLKEVNSAFFKFFDKYNSLEDFKKDHQSICDFFIDPKNGDEKYLFNDEQWLQKVLSSPSNTYKAAMEKDGSQRHFIINATQADKVKLGETFIVVTYIDITDLKNQEKLMYEQSKLISMGEMIVNIAHHWRQPLSVISTSASGMKLKKEYGMLEDDEFNDNCDIIDENAQKLSKTITDFSKLILKDTEKIDFELDEIIEGVFELIETSIESDHIILVKNIQEGIKINGSPSELIQSIVNIYSNANDVLLGIDEDERLFFVDIKSFEGKVEIKLTDNAGGIPDEVLPKIFEPYFTTKHQSQGTGMGLNAVYNSIQFMNGTIKAVNTKYEYNNKEYKGASFIIELPFVK